MHIVCAPSLPHFCWRGEGLNLQPIFKKVGLDKNSTFRGGFLGKRRMTFFRGGCNFYIKNILKYETFNDILKFI